MKCSITAKLQERNLLVYWLITSERLSNNQQQSAQNATLTIENHALKLFGKR
jgi:hypothetical protein